MAPRSRLARSLIWNKPVFHLDRTPIDEWPDRVGKLSSPRGKEWRNQRKMGGGTATSPSVRGKLGD
ncbi:hypothetical protein CR513_41546, partial [Mucuna pruriens]